MLLKSFAICWLLCLCISNNENTHADMTVSTTLVLVMVVVTVPLVPRSFIHSVTIHTHTNTHPFYVCLLSQRLCVHVIVKLVIKLKTRSKCGLWPDAGLWLVSQYGPTIISWHTSTTNPSKVWSVFYVKMSVLCCQSIHCEAIHPC